MAPDSSLHLRHPPERLYDIGRLLYRKGNYEEALDTFHAAEKACGPSGASLDILTYRAATFSKLGNHQAALQDARDMVKRDQAAPAGYLALGKTLLDLEKRERALQIYERGLRLCSKDDAKYRTLQQQVQKLKDPSPGVNFLDKLPAEIVYHILSFLSFKALLPMQKVSRQWRRFLTTSPSLWSTIDYSATKRPVRLIDIDATVLNARGKLRHITLNNYGTPGTRTLEIICKRSKELESLTLLAGGPLDQTLKQALPYTQNVRKIRLSGNVKIEYQTASDIIRHCPSLSEYGLHGVLQFSRSQRTAVPDSASLQELTIDLTDIRTSDFNINEIVNDTPRLRKLRVTTNLRTQHCSLRLSHALAASGTELQSLYVDGRWTPAPQGHPRVYYLSKRLKSLDLINAGLAGRSQTGETFEMAALKAWREATPHDALLPDLSQLDLCEDSWYGVQPELVAEILCEGREQCAKLERLGITAMGYSQEDLVALIRHERLQDLRRLRITKCEALTDEVAAVMASSLTKVRELDLSQSRSLTGVGVRALVEGLEGLQRLNLVDCGGVGRDAVEWAEKRGVRTRFGLRVER